MGAVVVAAVLLHLPHAHTCLSVVIITQPYWCCRVRAACVQLDAWLHPFSIRTETCAKAQASSSSIMRHGVSSSNEGSWHRPVRQCTNCTSTQHNVIAATTKTGRQGSGLHTTAATASMQTSVGSTKCICGQVHGTLLLVQEINTSQRAQCCTGAEQQSWQSLHAGASGTPGQPTAGHILQLCPMRL